MKFSKGFYACTGMIILFFGCAGNKEKTDSTVSTDTVATEIPGPPASTIITTPELMLIAKHKVSNFAKWKTSFEQHDSMKLANGVRNYVIGRSLEDSNMLLVALKVDDLAKAKAMSSSNDLKTAMKEGGVIGKPEIQFANILFQDTAIIGNVPRALTTFTVKDWNAWKTSFEQGAQERTDNGISVRNYGHDVDDNRKVFLVVAIMDTAKARAYWTSDALKKRRQDGGVISTPERFVFSIAARY